MNLRIVDNLCSNEWHSGPNLPAFHLQMDFAGHGHTVLLVNDGEAVAFGISYSGRCNIPPLPAGMTYTKVSAGAQHTVLLRSDGHTLACGSNDEGQCDIPPLEGGHTYTQVSAGWDHTVLLRSDGNAVTCGCSDAMWQVLDQPLPEQMSWTQVSAGSLHTVCLRSDGRAFSSGRNRHGQSNIPPLEAGMSYTQVSAGQRHTVLLRSDGRALACGSNEEGQCNIPPLEAGTSYIHVAAGGDHTVLLRSDGSAVACGSNQWGQCRIPSPKPGSFFICDTLLVERDIILQLDFICQDHSVTLVCSNLAGQEKLRWMVRLSDFVWEAHRHIVEELNVSLPRLKIVLPDGQLLDSLYRANRHPDIRDLLGMQPPPPPLPRLAEFQPSQLSPATMQPQLFPPAPATPCLHGAEWHTAAGWEPILVARPCWIRMLVARPCWIPVLVARPCWIPIWVLTTADDI